MSRDESRLHLKIESRLADVSLVGRAMRAACATRTSVEEILCGVEIAVVEAVTNAIRHAYAGLPGRDVCVSLCLREREFEILVADRGTALPDGRLSTPPGAALDFDPGDIESLPEGGLGLIIIDRTVDEMAYESNAGTNTLRLRMLFDRPAA